MEVLASTGLFVMVFLILMEAWPLNAHIVDMARQGLAATVYGEQVMESVKAAGYGAAISTAPPHPTYVHYDRSNGVPVEVKLTYTVVVTPRSTNLKDVLVTVQWSDGKGTHHVDLETLLAGP